MGFLNIIFIFIVLCCSQFITLQAQKTFPVQFANFDQKNPDNLYFFNNRSNIDSNAIQVTRDTAADPRIFELLNQSGRVFLNKPFRLWDGEKSDNTTVAASFESYFRINISPQNDTAGAPPLNNTLGGLTFLIAPNMDLPPNNSSGQFLGLTNASTDGNSTNQIIAVEFDNSMQGSDPDGNHIGIDINSIRSKKVESLTPLGIVLAPINDTFFYDVWVQYNGTAKVMEVYIAKQEDKDGQTKPKPASPILTFEVDIREHLKQESYFGFSASTGAGYQLNCVLRWNFTITYFPEKNDWWKIAVGVGVPVVVLGLILAAWLVWLVQKKRKLRNPSLILGVLKSLPGTPREFKFKELKKATENFGEKKKLGQGGYGVVYKGWLAGEGLEIAVKWFSRESIKGQGDFLAELSIINRLRHKHLVKLLGWCHRHGKLLLVYEYMPHGSLDQHLFIGGETDPLSWELRCKIVSGVGYALQYLHNEFEQRVVHRDLKASNIMLDSNFNARLGDFGLARALDNERTSYTEGEGVAGTIGYIAPECLLTGKATEQSDIYAFGAVLLEVVCGQRPGTRIGGFQSLVDWVWFLHRDGRILEAVDIRLKEDFVVEEAKRLLLLGLACSHPIANERPRTSDVVQIILGSVPVPNVPPFRPAFVWPSALPIDIDSSQTDTTTSIPISPFNSGWSQIDTGHTNSSV
ncbi:PREDICTED: probable L-type lectin-domain containing receptor kinase S.5 [Ipomoea nil]|uniref:probable L-type lectin-domain containing receptor kinase S.5 n=1 Tax=Ipomoea nil TaxID=35883 RepID=UPI0009013BC7|nr:PREDICTED: probable L-type lectin-domain containing receptor kinase S.5 [Ipomoea nil]